MIGITHPGVSVTTRELYPTGFITLRIIIMAGMAVFYVAGYLIEERRIWPVITASPTRTMF